MINKRVGSEFGLLTEEHTNEVIYFETNDESISFLKSHVINNHNLIQDEYHDFIDKETNLPIKGGSGFFTETETVFEPSYVRIIDKDIDYMIERIEPNINTFYVINEREHKQYGMLTEDNDSKRHTATYFRTLKQAQEYLLDYVRDTYCVYIGKDKKLHHEDIRDVVKGDYKLFEEKELNEKSFIQFDLSDIKIIIEPIKLKGVL